MINVKMYIYAALPFEGSQFACRYIEKERIEQSLQIVDAINSFAIIHNMSEEIWTD